MKRIALIAGLAIAAIFSNKEVRAQMPYNFTASTSAYQPLTNGIPISGSTMWDDASTFEIPLGFNFKFNGVTVTDLKLTGGVFLTADTTGIQSGFGLVSTSLQDRGKFTAESPIRYVKSGTVGSRIFKLEIFNAGFFEEGKAYGTLDDSISFQVWLYEGTNAIEIHYGGSKISHFSEYFGNVFMMGYLKNYSFSTGAFDRLYVLTGQHTAPTLDSVTNIINQKGFTTHPSSGITYRFTPKTNSTGINTPGINNNFCRVYVPYLTNALTIESLNGSTLHYEMFSINGQKVLKGDIDGKGEVDTKMLMAGSYVVRVWGANNELYVNRIELE